MPVNPNSIRQTILTMLGEGKNTKEIEAVLKERFPNSMAAQKAVRHVAWYKAQIKKAAKGDAKAVKVVAHAASGGVKVPEPVNVDGKESATDALALAAAIDAKLAQETEATA